MMKAIALVALSLALEAGFLFQIATPAPAAGGAVSTAPSVARVAAARPARG